MIFICPQKKVFQKMTKFEFLALHHDLYISGRCCKYLLCSLDPEVSIGSNYSIIHLTKKILTQEKHIFSVLSKSNVDEAQIQVEISDILRNSRVWIFKSICRKIQRWYEKTVCTLRGYPSMVFDLQKELGSYLLPFTL